jgi:hypothetical protein
VTQVIDDLFINHILKDILKYLGFNLLRLIEERDRLSSRQTELNNEQEEIQAERRLIQMDSERLRWEWTHSDGFGEAQVGMDSFRWIRTGSGRNELIQMDSDRLR